MDNSSNHYLDIITKLHDKNNSVCDNAKNRGDELNSFMIKLIAF